MLFNQASRLAKITSPLGPEVLLLKDMGGGEELGRLFNYELQLHSLDNAIDLNQVLGKPMCVSLQLDGGGERYFHRHRGPFQPERRPGPVRQLPGHPAPVVLAADSYLRLPDFPEPHHPADHQAGVPRLGLFRFRRRPEPALSRVGILRAVSRDQFRLRQPLDGAGRDLLLLPP